MFDFTIIIDTRETTPLEFPDHVKTEAGTLQSGDYSVKGIEHLFSVERKTIADLVGSLTTGRDRFERELHRLRGFHFTRLLIIGHKSEIMTHSYRSKATPKSILNSLHAFEMRYQIPIVFANEKTGADLIVKWAYWFTREIIKNAECIVSETSQKEDTK